MSRTQRVIRLQSMLQGLRADNMYFTVKVIDVCMILHNFILCIDGQKKGEPPLEMGLTVEYREDTSVKDRLQLSQRPGPTTWRIQGDCDQYSWTDDTQHREHKTKLKSERMQKLQARDLLRPEVRNLSTEVKDYEPIQNSQ
eukprot:766930-Hanusia_phi.AAC.5